MSCPGLHCAGCAGGAAIPVWPLAAVYGLAWIAEHIIEVIAVSAACGVLALAAVVALMRWADRRDARRAAQWQFRYVREVPNVAVTNLPPGATNLTAVCDTERPALGFRDLHIHIDGVPSAEQATVIRQALSGRASQS